MQAEVEQLFQSGADKFDKGLYEEAIDEFSKALSINPNHLSSNYQIAYSLCRLERNLEALVYANKIVEIDPDWGAYEYRAAIKKGIGDLEGAKEDYKIAWTIPKDGCI